MLSCLSAPRWKRNTSPSSTPLWTVWNEQPARPEQVAGDLSAGKAIRRGLFRPEKQSFQRGTAILRQHSLPAKDLIASSFLQLSELSSSEAKRIRSAPAGSRPPG